MASELTCSSDCKEQTQKEAEGHRRLRETFSLLLLWFSKNRFIIILITAGRFVQLNAIDRGVDTRAYSVGSSRGEKIQGCDVNTEKKIRIKIKRRDLIIVTK